eukprot:TRINITY_DN2534_c0_g2_i2.p1 TRINITY_DN2534_c0_g2~~TRINITY_DN2534_c0_g2_i2.p1  ORF type:complete len:341 (-),score=37.70 TRINITY_DN2534_c0_g2_i2:46-1068(-)
MRIGYHLDDKKIRNIKWSDFVELCHERNIKTYKIDYISTNSDEAVCNSPACDIFLLRLTNELAIGDLDSLKKVEFFKRYSEIHQCIVVDPINCQKNVVRRDLMTSIINRVSLLPGLNLRSINTTNNFKFNGQQLQQFHNFPFPSICKRVQASGSQSAHKMAILFNTQSLQNYIKNHIDESDDSEWILQEYVDHNSTLFKVYVVASESYITSKLSLPNFSIIKQNQQQYDDDGYILFDSQVWKDNIPSHLIDPKIINNSASSSSSSTTSNFYLDPHPPIDIINNISKNLSQHLGLSLFGYDLLRDVTSNQFVVVDINYFPDYKGVDNFHSKLLNHFIDLKK